MLIIFFCTRAELFSLIFKVLRLRAADRPADEVAQEIYKFYKDLQATRAEKEIQKLYASKQ